MKVRRLLPPIVCCSCSNACQSHSLGNLSKLILVQEYAELNLEHTGNKGIGQDRPVCKGSAGQTHRLQVGECRPWRSDL
jgi:hypothetical protein